ncbi:hypothetical protein FHS61_001530 [Altererythrobacter atlanticus]|uniref:DUF8021 domain-containing protein n=1 Tax=Croceibacterium atlanticum TaxID=1267766 RepID=A0A0F7KZE7_9SPHN|nr:hypothetical protein [Croceibacterium atlanticum]AKH44210.1 hypothetical protein WYH_03191 [Croceibacterium atlanticum]MBB5732521.1 hypothetical protein [Croceibacterium atlanticum]
MKTCNLFTAAALIALATPAAAQAQDCDRDCLIGLADDYVAALVAHDPSAVPLSGNVTMVENIQTIAPGDGLWNSLARGPDGSFTIHVADPVSEQVGIMTMVTDSDNEPALIGIRLKWEDGAITEAEHMVTRDLSPVALGNLQVLRPAIMQEVPEAYADSRSRMIWLGKSYYDALDNNNSRHSAMADDCERRENGFQTARNPMVRPTPEGPSNGQRDPIFAYLGGLGCAAQMDTNMWEYITSIDNRRVEIADPVTGLVWGVSHFRHAFDKKDFDLVGVPWADSRHLDFQPFDMPAIHIYKIWGGQIHEIEAMGFTTAYRAPLVFAD